MEYTNDITLKIGKHNGPGTITYTEEDGRFVIRKKASNSGKGAVVGVMFGAIGQAVMDSLSTGEELASFTAKDINLVTITEKKRKKIYSLYPEDGSDYYEITLDQKKEMNSVITRVLADKMEGAVPPAAPQTGVPAPQTAESAPQTAVSKPQPAAPEKPKPAPAAKPAPAPVQPAAPAAAPRPVQTPTQPPAPHAIPHPVAQPVRQTAQQTGRPCVLLYMHTGELAGRTFRFAPGTTVVIGRDPARCNLALPQYGRVSGVHCCIEVGERMLRVMDMNSTNGTGINGNRLAPRQPVMLRQGDYLILADNNCVFQVGFEA